MKNNCCKENLHLVEKLCFSEVVELAAGHLELLAVNDFSESVDSVRSHFTNFRLELRQFCETGNCGQVSSSAASANPTFLQPTTGKWFVFFAACPFQGYFPLPLKKLKDEKDAKHGIIADYCRDELKEQLTEFRKRIDKIMFYFHPCDALAFCYGDLPYKFDLIDTSSLADTLGLANLINGASRKLISDQSLLLTESSLWLKVAPSVDEYVQKVLCCPLSLIPTIYGFRLIDKVEWGQEVPRSRRTITTTVMPARLRWKKTMPFDQVPLVFSQSLKTCLKRLLNACFSHPSLDPLIACAQAAEFNKTMLFFSPLTFFYVVSDLLRRGGIREPSALMTTFCSLLLPAYWKSFTTCYALMEDRPVWRVVVRSHNLVLDELILAENPLLRLILVPTKDLPVSSLTSEEFDDLLNSIDNHFIDNIEVNLKMKSSCLIEWVDVAFLLEDRSLLESYSGIVIEANAVPAFFIGPLSDSKTKVELFKRPHLWPCQPSPVAASSGSQPNPQLIGESCRETEDVYTLRFKILSGGSSKPPSGRIQSFCVSVCGKFKF